MRRGSRCAATFALFLGILLAVTLAGGRRCWADEAAPAPPPPGGTALAPSPTATVVSLPPPPPPLPSLPRDPPPVLTDDNPHSDRVVLMPTAYTHPRGTFFVSSYDIVLLQLGYAITDDTQITLSGVPPLGAERIALIDLTMKSVVSRGRLVRVAALGSVSGVVGKEIGLLAIGRAGGVVQLCVRQRCASSFTLSSNVALAGPVLLMVNGVGGIWRLAQGVSLLAEAVTAVPIGTQGGQFNGAALGGGFRFSSPRWGFDLTLVHPLGTTNANIPLLAFTYRTAPPPAPSPSPAP